MDDFKRDGLGKIKVSSLTISCQLPARCISASMGIFKELGIFLSEVTLPLVKVLNDLFISNPG